VEETLDTFSVCLDEVLLFSEVGVFRWFLLFPLVHKLVCFLWIFIDLFAIKMSFLRKVEIGRFRFSELGFEKKSVSVSVPR
jgi:hypothetical protein